MSSNAGDSSLTEPGGAIVEFPGDASVELVFAACLAASGQLQDLIARAGRLNLALASAKRRAKRRQPHEREGLIFHLERQNARLSAFVHLANEAAQVSGRAAEQAATEWDAARGEARTAREANGRLCKRVALMEVQAADLERELAAERCAVARSPLRHARAAATPATTKPRPFPFPPDTSGARPQGS